MSDTDNKTPAAAETTSSSTDTSSNDSSATPAASDSTAASGVTDTKSSDSPSLSESEASNHLSLNKDSYDWWMKQDKKEAGDLLLRKAMVLMGVSDSLGENSDRGKALKSEANELLSFASDLQNRPEAQQAMEEAHKLLSSLNIKYESVSHQTKGLQDETWKLWSSVSASNEASTLMDQGQKLFSDWTNYAKSDQGKEYLTSAQQKLQGQSGDFVSMIDNHALNEEGKPLVQKDKLMDVANQAADVGRELHKELIDDSDVAALIAQAQKDFSGATTFAQSSIHSSILEDPNNPLNITDMTEEQKTALSLMKGEQYIRDLRNSSMAQKLIQQGTAYISSGALSPTAIMGQGQSLYSDEKSRQMFINKVKDSALEFLMAYLPTAKVPPVEGEKDGVEYKLSGIDLSGFKVLSEDVEVAINEEDGLGIWARNISCTMKSLEFTYNKKTFPKVSGEGKAEAIASGVKFMMRLELELPERYRKLVSPSGSKSPSKNITPAESPRAQIAGTTPALPPPSPQQPKPTQQTQPPQQQQQRPQQPTPQQQLQQQQQRPAQPQPVAAKPAGAKPQLTPAQIQQLQFLQQQQNAQKRTVVNSSLSKQVTNAAPTQPKPAQPKPAQPQQQQQRPPPVTTQQPNRPQQQPTQFNFPRSGSSSALTPSGSHTPNGTPISKENSIRNQKAVAKAIAADQPRLVLAGCKVTLDNFNLKILNGDYKFIMNFLLKLFNESVREYIEIQLNNEIQEQSSKLLATVNELSVDYLPLLEKIMVKADKIVEKKTGRSVITGVTNYLEGVEETNEDKEKDKVKIELIEEDDKKEKEKPQQKS